MATSSAASALWDRRRLARDRTTGIRRRVRHDRSARSPVFRLPRRPPRRPRLSDAAVAAVVRRPSPHSRWPSWLQRLAAVGADPTDTEELRVRKTVLVLSASLM